MKKGLFKKKKIRREVLTFLPTLAAVVRLPTGDPFASLEPPVVRVGQHHLHEHIIVRSQAEAGYVEAEEREHASGNFKTNVKNTEKVKLYLLNSPGGVCLTGPAW